MEPNRTGVPFRLLAVATIVMVLGACQSVDTRPDEISPTAAKPASSKADNTASQAAPAVAEPPRDGDLRLGYACCNLRHAGDSISDANLAQLPFVPVGTPIKVRRIDGQYADAEVDGKPMRLGHEQGREQESIGQWINKIVVLDDPKVRLARFPPRIRNAIAKGQLLRGMNREQVIMAVGHPPADARLKLDGPYWRYWWSGFAPYYVYWAKDGTVSRISGHSETVGNMTYSGK
jgi:hypothetical protein